MGTEWAVLVGAGVEVEHRRCLGLEVGVAHEDHDWCCQGLSASAASQRRTVDTEAVMPPLRRRPASSGVLHRDSGTCCSAGNWHAQAATLARSAGVKIGGRPERGASARPSMPLSWNRARHL